MPLPDIRLVASADPVSSSAQAIALPLYAGAELRADARAVTTALGADVTGYLEREGAKGERGETHSVALPAGSAVAQLFLVGLGDPDELTPAILRKAGGALARKAAKLESLATTIPAET
ncbi:MAG: M17 family peptidase N-terminal domain-containing protein, partial [Mycobacteriales bacterium]